MTHEELDTLGPKLEARCNEAITERFPQWSRYAVDQMLDRTMEELAPDWGWIKMSVVNGVPQMRLTQYHGEVTAMSDYCPGYCARGEPHTG